MSMNEKDAEVYRKLSRLAALIVSLDDDGEYHALCEDNPGLLGEQILVLKQQDQSNEDRFFCVNLALTKGSKDLSSTVSMIKSLASELLFPRPSPNGIVGTFTRYDLWERLKKMNVTAITTKEEGITNFEGIVLFTHRKRTLIALKF